jgi:lipoyl(octanoyl) transferase
MSYVVIYEDIGLKDYKETWIYQEKIFQKIISQKMNRTESLVNGANMVQNLYISVEHPHVFTLGKNGSINNLLINSIQLRAKDAAFYRIDRGGDITYHGPGQIVGYPIFDLETFKLSLKEYINLLEEVIILTVMEFGIKGQRLPKATGVWLDTDIPGKARKICAIGVRASRYVTMHGFAFNVNTDLNYFNYINPCGYIDKGVTSLERELGEKQDLDKIKSVVKKKMQKVFDIEWINK